MHNVRETMVLRRPKQDLFVSFRLNERNQNDGQYGKCKEYHIGCIQMLNTDDTDDNQCGRTNGCVDRCNQTVCLNKSESSEAGSDNGWDQISDSADTESDENGCKYDQSHGTVLENHQQQCDEVPYTMDDGSVFCVFYGMIENQFLCINSLVLGRSCYF